MGETKHHEQVHDRSAIIYSYFKRHIVWLADLLATSNDACSRYYTRFEHWCRNWNLDCLHQTVSSAGSTQSKKEWWELNTVRINGTTIVSSGRSVVIKNGQVIIDGVDVTPDSKNITIEIQGNVDKIEVGACDKINVTGNVSVASTQSGDIRRG